MCAILSWMPGPSPGKTVKRFADLSPICRAIGASEAAQHRVEQAADICSQGLHRSDYGDRHKAGDEGVLQGGDTCFIPEFRLQRCRQFSQQTVFHAASLAANR